MTHISIPSQAGEFEAYLSTPSDRGKYPGVILIEEIWGVDAHITSVADRLVQEGFLVIAPELIPEGILQKITPDLKEHLHDPARRHEFQPIVREAMLPIRQPEFAKAAVQKLRACIDYLLEHKDGNGIVGSWGFCFGGTMSFHLAVNDTRLGACVVYYGQPPTPTEDVQTISCPVLDIAGARDENIVKSLPALATAMKEYGKDFTLEVYPDVGHAFFNDINVYAYNKQAATDAWEKTILFLNKHLRP